MSQRPAGDATVEINADNSGLKAGMAEAEDLLRRYAQAVTSVGRSVGGVQPYGLIENVDGKIRRAAEAYELLEENATRYRRSQARTNAGGFKYDQTGGLSERTRRMIEARGYGEESGPGANLFRRVTRAGAVATSLQAVGAALTTVADQMERIERGDPFGGAYEFSDGLAKNLARSVPIVGEALEGLYRVSAVYGRFLWGVDQSIEDGIQSHEARSARLFEAIGKAENQIKRLETERVFGAGSVESKRMDMEDRLAAMSSALKAAGADAGTVQAYVSKLGYELEKSLTDDRKLENLRELEHSLKAISDASNLAGKSPIDQQLAKLFELGANPIEILAAEGQLKRAEELTQATERRKSLEQEIARITRDAADAWLSPMERQLVELERLGATAQQIASAQASLEEQQRALDAAQKTAEAERDRLKSLKEIEDTLGQLRRDAAGMSPSDAIAQKLLGLGASADLVGEAIRLQQSIRARGIAEDILNRPATSAGTFSAISASMMGLGRVDLVTISRTVSDMSREVSAIRRRIEFMEGNEFA